MDIGDLIFLIVIGIGFLSSLSGASKKKRKATRQPQTQRPPVPTASTRRTTAATTQTKKKSRLQEARERAMSQMEELLGELEHGPKKPIPTSTQAPRPELPTLTGESPDLVLPPSAPAAREMPPSVPAPRDGSQHKLFHDKYIKPVKELKARSTSARARRHLSPKSLREAVLLREILGRPKALK